MLPIVPLSEMRDEGHGETRIHRIRPMEEVLREEEERDRKEAAAAAPAVTPAVVMSNAPMAVPGVAGGSSWGIEGPVAPVDPIASSFEEVTEDPGSKPPVQSWVFYALVLGLMGTVVLAMMLVVVVLLWQIDATTPDVPIATPPITTTTTTTTTTTRPPPPDDPDPFEFDDPKPKPKPKPKPDNNGTPPPPPPPPKPKTGTPGPVTIDVGSAPYMSVRITCPSGAAFQGAFSGGRVTIAGVPGEPCEAQIVGPGPVQKATVTGNQNLKCTNVAQVLDCR